MSYIKGEKRSPFPKGFRSRNATINRKSARRGGGGGGRRMRGKIREGADLHLGFLFRGYLSLGGARLRTAGISNWKRETG